MARLFGFIGNRDELGPRALAEHSKALTVHRGQALALGWGVGFYQFGEVLLRRRPLDERETIQPPQLTEALKTDLLIGHVRNPTVGNLRTENTHPFRFRQWLFAQTGTLQRFDTLRTRLLEAQPDFLTPNVRGDTDSELFFYLVLSYLHDQSQLEVGAASVASIGNALRSALSFVDRLCDEQGLPHQLGDALLTDGERLVAVHRSGQMATLLIDKEEDVVRLLGVDSSGSGRPQNLDRARCSVVASEVPELPVGWRRAEPNSLIWFERSKGPIAEPI
jgi:predicted glutamine amidotransferase